jgi:hypothetical protein
MPIKRNVVGVKPNVLINNVYPVRQPNVIRKGFHGIVFLPEVVLSVAFTSRLLKSMIMASTPSPRPDRRVKKPDPGFPHPPNPIAKLCQQTYTARQIKKREETKSFLATFYPFRGPPGYPRRASERYGHPGNVLFPIIS